MWLRMSREASSVVPAKTWSFEPTGRLVHLRWAIAELAIGIETPSAGLEASERALRIFSQRALTLLEGLDGDEVFNDARYTAEVGIGEMRSALSQGGPLRAERARSLHEARRKLHHALIVVAEALSRQGSRAVSGFDPPKLNSLLALRQMFAAYRGGLVSAGEQRARLSWALEVAAAELSVVLANPALSDLPATAQHAVRDLSLRITAWGLKEPEPVLGRSLYREAAMLSGLSAEVSSQPVLVEHDEQSLSELAALLSNEPAGALLESKVLGHLFALRGLDAELDRLELSLIYGAADVLGSLSQRVTELRSRLSRFVPRAASWS